MTTNDRIEAEIQAEAKRIEAWNDCELYPESGMAGHPLFSAQIQSLARHLVANRLQVQNARTQALVAALKTMLGTHDCPGSEILERGCEDCAPALAALKLAGEDA